MRECRLVEVHGHAEAPEHHEDAGDQRQREQRRRHHQRDVAARFLAEAQGDRYPDWQLQDWLVFAKRLCRLGPGGRILFDYDMRIAEPFKLPGGESGFDLWTAFAGLTGIPSLVLRGELSDLLSDATVERMLAENPSMEAVTVPRVGHAPTLDEPEAAAAIDRLLKRVKARRKSPALPRRLSSGAAGDPPRPISQATRRKRWRDVDLSTGMVSIRNTQAHSTKTGRERSIPLVGEARKVLARRYQAKTADTSVIGLDDPVLTDAAGHAIKPHRASSRFKHFIRKTGLDDRLRLHDLRHTCASWMVQRGESLYTVQAILGHSTPVVAQRYSHLAPDAMRAAMERAFGNG